VQNVGNDFKKTEAELVPASLQKEERKENLEKES